MTNARTPTTHTHAQSDVTNLTTDLAARQLLSQKNVANGYAGLGADGKVAPAQGGLSYPIRPVSTSTSATNADETIIVNNTGGIVTVTLPSSSTFTAPLTIIRANTSTFNVIVAPNGAETINGSTQLLLIEAGVAATIIKVTGGWALRGLVGVVDTAGGTTSIAQISGTGFTIAATDPVSPGTVVGEVYLNSTSGDIYQWT
jgi:hypothetical protein